jgi:NDP-sugar pyrophosphorylase family protein
MSGVGKRFADAGYENIKPLIVVDGKPIIAHVVDMFPGENNFVFICNQNHLDSLPLRAVLKDLVPNCRIIAIAPHKMGPVFAVSQCFDEIDDDDEIIVNYCDFYSDWDYQDFLRDTHDRKAEGCVPSYRGFHPHMLGTDNYAFIKDNDRWLQAIQEKKPFSNDRMAEYASNGTYYFRHGRHVKNYFRELIEKDIQVNGEFYVSMVYNLLVADGLPVSVYEVPHMLQWGTPKDLEEYQEWSDYFRALVSDTANLSSSVKSRHGQTANKRKYLNSSNEQTAQRLNSTNEQIARSINTVSEDAARSLNLANEQIARSQNTVNEQAARNWNTSSELTSRGIGDKDDSAQAEFETRENELTVLIPMAGHGSRFQNAGYRTPKPLIPVSGKPMVVQAADSLPEGDRYVFVALKTHLQNSAIRDVLQSSFSNCNIVELDKVTEGQACTCEFGLTESNPPVDLESPLIIGACDNGMLYDPSAFQKMVDDGVDAIAFTFRNHPASKRNPKMYGWLKTSGDVIEGVSVKVPISETPENDHAIVGSFYFRKATFLIDGLKRMREKNRRVNGEFYVDSLIGELAEMGMDCRVFEVDYYVCWGTPDDLKVFEYWQEFFNDCHWHPYKLELDPTAKAGAGVVSRG